MKPTATDVGAPPRIAVEAWQQLQPRDATVHEAQPLQRKKGKAEVWRLMLRGSRDRAVIAKRASMVEAQLEDEIYRSILPRIDLADLTYFGVTPDPGGAAAWIFVEDAAGEPFSPHDPGHRRLAGRWLGNLHTRAARLRRPALLRDAGLAHYRLQAAQVQRLLTQAAQNAVISATDLMELSQLRELLDTVLERWSSLSQGATQFPDTLIHGSFGPRNMHVGFTDGVATLHVFDWAAAGWGMPARDVGKLTGDSVAGGLDDYLSVVGHDRGDIGPQFLTRLAVLGDLLRSIEHLSWVAPRLMDTWVDGPMDIVRRHHKRLHMATESLLQTSQKRPTQ